MSVIVYISTRMHMHVTSRYYYHYYYAFLFACLVWSHVPLPCADFIVGSSAAQLGLNIPASVSTL